jgi:hypothetical protein
VLLRLPGKGDDPLTEASETRMTESEQGVVTLLVYSGRPNPTWPLGRDLEASITRHLEQLPMGRAAENTPPSVLGYNGFRVELPTVGGPGQTLTVGKGVVAVAGPTSPSTAWHDTTGLEAELLEDARRNGQADVLNALGVDSGSSSRPGG